MLKGSKEDRSILTCYRGQIPKQINEKIVSLSSNDIINI